MSAAPNLPPFYNDQPPERPEPPVRRSHRWTRVVAWIFGGIALLILLIALAVIYALHSPRVHQYVLSTAQTKASAALGSQVRARDFKLSWSGISPTVDLYDVHVAGANPYPTPDLLQVDRIHVAVKVTSLLRKTWYLDDITVDHPVVRVFVDKSGADNLPQTQTTNQEQKSNTSVFDLGIRHALLNNGEIFYNNQKSDLQADLRDLHLQSGFDVAKTEYAGNLGYSDGVIKMQNFNPLPHSLEAEFKANKDKFTLTKATVRSGPSFFSLNATLENYAQPKVTVNYDASVDSGQFAHILKNPSLPVGVIHANGRMDYEAVANQPFLNGVVLHGQVSSPQLLVSTPQFRGPIRNLGANYSVANGNLLVNNLHANVLGGQLTGTLQTRDLAGNSHSTLDAQINGVSLAQAKADLRSSPPALQKAGLAGTASGRVHATWGKTMNDLLAQSDLSLNGSMTPQPGAAAVPLQGTIHANYNGATKAIALNNSYVRAGDMTLNLNGAVGTHSALSLNLQNVNLQQIQTMAASFGVAVPQNLGLSGIASFVGTVSGSTTNPHLVGDLTVNDLHAKGTAWRFLKTHVDASPSRAALQNGQLHALDRGAITFNLATALQHWKFTDNSQFQAGLNASQIDIGALAKAAAPSTPVAGVLNASMNLSGTELSPVGTGKLSLTNGKVSGETIQNLTANMQANGNVLTAALNAKLPAGGANGNLNYDTKAQTFTADLRVPGLQLGQLETVKGRGMDLNGVLSLVANGRGSIHNPELTANAQIPRLAMNGQTISGLALQANVANKVANFNLNSNVVNTALKAQGTVQLVGDYYGNVTLDSQVIPLAPLVAAYAPSQAGAITGQTELHATLRGPLKRKDRVEAHVVIPQLSVNYKNAVQLAAAAPIKADYANGTLQLQRSSIRGTDTNLEFEGTVPVAGNGPARLMLVGNVDLRLASLINPDIASSGQLQFDINGMGNRANPNFQGQIKIVNATFATGDLPVGLQNGNGVMTLTSDRLNITSFTGTVGDGTVRATGGVVYRPSMRFDLALSGRGMRILIPGGVRTGVTTDLSLTGTPMASLLRGNVRINQLQFTPEFDLMNFMGSFGGGEATPPPTEGFTNGLKLDIGVSSTSGINVSSRTMSLQGAANLRVTGTGAQPVVLGRVNLEGGDLILMGNRYILNGGTVDFINPSRTEPNLNVSVSTTIQQYNIQMRFWGPADHMHTNYASDPALPPSDIINLIAFGKTSEAQAANPTPPGNLGAESMIASQVSSQVTSRLEKIAGISQLSIDPVLGGNGQNPGAKIAIQQRVTSKIFVDFATDISSTQNQTIRLEYHASPRLSFSGTRDQNGGFGFDTQIKKTW